MNSELAAAAERLLACGTNLGNGKLCDRNAVTTWALPLLDPTQIDAEWLNECGWTNRDSSHYSPVNQFGVGLSVEVGEEIAVGLYGWGSHIPCQATTRGELRLLCAALHIPLTESEDLQ